VTPNWLWVRRDARRRLRSLAGLAFLLALAGGVVLAAVAAANVLAVWPAHRAARTRPAEILRAE
jgi:ABC-type lipoprotein release transport system permease subunit